MAWDRGRTMRWLLISIGITLVGTFLLWRVFGPRAFFAFLFLPFFPFLWGGRAKEETVLVRSCPRCDLRSTDPDDRYCPRDGAPLV